MTDTSKEARHQDAARNLILNRAINDLEQIINNHDPETDVPIKDGAWDRLDRLACEIECRERDALRAQLQAAREVIGRAGRHADVIRGAVESNQVVDKDVHGVAKMIRDYCRTALKSTSTEGEG
ncbi:hypothetical protein VWY34_14385 [Phaeobacter sp. JH20_02]|uniref:hypothetical protein n=1 Tax=unclassified Phaeobacter TaxID=2621772 RepID=UPI003A83D6B7